MLIYNDILYKFIHETETPEEIFPMVMNYARRSKKNSWKCLAEVLSTDRYTIIFYEKVNDKYIPLGYINAIITEDNDIFLFHGYLEHSTNLRKELLDVSLNIIQNISGKNINKIILQSPFKPILWKKYGFTLSEEKIYEKKFQKINLKEE